MLRAGWLALFIFVWIIGAFLGSTFEYQESTNGEGISYTTGSANFTHNDATVTGNGTTWNNATMAGGNMKCDADGHWYRISSVTNVTTLELSAIYTGTTVVTASYTMAQSPGWSGTGTGGYNQSPTTTLTYILDVRNAFQRVPNLGNVTLPIPNGEYFDALGKVLLWKWSFLADYDMFYWIFCAPFVAMGILSLILIGYGVLVGNLRFQ